MIKLFQSDYKELHDITQMLKGDFFIKKTFKPGTIYTLPREV